jgi:RecA-family ATPase
MFLNRKTTKGKVLVLALEEQAEVLNIQYSQLGINKTDDILLHVGRILSDNAVDELYAACLDYKPSLIIIDTLMLFCKTQNINDYTEMNSKLESLRDVARKTGAHVLCIHHQNKSRDNFGAATILGSAAIHGAVDCAMIFNKDGSRRSIQTTQRAGKPFDNEELIFNKDNQTYVIGKKRNLIDEVF